MIQPLVRRRFGSHITSGREVRLAVAGCLRGGFPNALRALRVDEDRLVLTTGVSRREGLGHTLDGLGPDCVSTMPRAIKHETERPGARHATLMGA